MSYASYQKIKTMIETNFFPNQEGILTPTKETKMQNLHKNRFRKIPSHRSTPSSTWEAISGGMRGDGGPIIRSSPTRIVSSIVGCESTEAHKHNKKNRV